MPVGTLFSSLRTLPGTLYKHSTLSNWGEAARYVYPCNPLTRSFNSVETGQAQRQAFHIAGRYLFGIADKNAVSQAFDTLALKNGTHQTLEKTCGIAHAFITSATLLTTVIKPNWNTPVGQLKLLYGSIIPQLFEAASRLPFYYFAHPERVALENEKILTFKEPAKYVPEIAGRLNFIQRALEKSKDPVHQQQLVNLQEKNRLNARWESISELFKTFNIFKR